MISITSSLRNLLRIIREAMGDKAGAQLSQVISAECFASWLERHPAAEVLSRNRGTTFANGASHGVPQALQAADRWHLIHNLSGALEKVLARPHADLKRAFLREEKPQSNHSMELEVLVPAKNPSQAEASAERSAGGAPSCLQTQELPAPGGVLLP